MSTLSERLVSALEEEEHRTVGNAFGGIGKAKIYSMASIRRFILGELEKADAADEVASRLLKLRSLIDHESTFEKTLDCLVRFSFMIELTNLKIGSTKLKTRWVSQRIKTAEEGSFEVVDGEFSPGTDPRSVQQKECIAVFLKAIQLGTSVIEQNSVDVSSLFESPRVPYEYVLTYTDSQQSPVHTSENICLVDFQVLNWNLKARGLLKNIP